MSDHDIDATGVLDTVKDSLDDVGMHTTVEQIMAAGRTRLRRRFAGMTAGLAAGVAAVTGLAVVMTPAAPATTTGNGIAPKAVHIRAAAYTVDSQNDGTVHVTWDKQRYFEDHEGLQAALRAAGFPVLIKVGEFCRGPLDTAPLDPSGVGAGVDRVEKGESGPDGKVTIVFTPSAMPAGTELFIGYLNPAQLAITGGAPGSVERLVPTGVPLTCTTEAPPAHGPRPGDKTGK